ncbi:hypothetical protein [Pontibacter korlensis]
MKKTRFTESQIIKALKEHESSVGNLGSPPLPSTSGASATQDWKSKN